MRSAGVISVMVLSAILAVPSLAMACTCHWGGPFAKVALGQDLVVYGEVLDYYKHSMEVKVLEVFKGKEGRGTIRIWGDNGALCRPYVRSFPIGPRWVFAISSFPKDMGEDQPLSFWDRFFSRSPKRDYAISICGDFWLAVQGERAVGRITAPQHSQILEWVPLGEIISWVRLNGQGVRLSPMPATATDRKPEPASTLIPWGAATTARHATGDRSLRILHRDSTGNPQRNRPYSQKKMHCPQVVLLPFLVEER